MTETLQSVSHRNAKAALAATFFSDLAFILPIWILFGTEQLRLSVTATTVLFMTLWLGSGLLEIPTGALADRYGRKKVFLFGAALLALYPVVYILKLPVLVIFLVSLLAAFGSALRSGALVPVVHDSYKEEGRSDKEYHAFLSNERILTFIARAMSGVLGGIMYAANPQMPYFAILVSYLSMFVAGLFVIETTADRSKLSNRLHIGETLRLMKRVPILVALLVSYIALQLTGEAVWTSYQLFFKHDGVTPSGIGLIFSVIAVFSALGAYSCRFFMRKVGVLVIEMFVGSMVLATCILLASPSETLRLLSVLPSGFAFGLSLPPIIAVSQKYIDSKFHSTALSVISVAQYVVYGVASLYVAIVIDNFGVQTARKVLLAEAIVMMIVLTIIYIRNKRWDEIITPKDSAVENPSMSAA